MSRCLPPLVCLLAATLVAGCGGSSDNPAPDPALLTQGQQIFRFDTFGDEAQWTDVLRCTT